MRLDRAAAAAVVLMLVLPATVAHGERSQTGNLIVALNGGISPLALPRHRAVPVSVQLRGRVETADGSPLPRVTAVELGLAGRGSLFTQGLAVCPRARLRNATESQAMARCGLALVGKGRLRAQAFVPRQRPFKINARLLAFNGRSAAGRRAIWVHAFARDPPLSLVLPFIVQPQHGAFPTTLVARVPRSVGPVPHLAEFSLTLWRKFRYRGAWRSYVSASCPVPKPFTAGFLSFARAIYSFSDKRRAGIESVRSCRARRE